MRSALVGCTGFVGGNIAARHPFEGLYHSKNIGGAFGTRPELLVYAGLPAAKYLANTDPDGDLAVVKNAMENIRQIAPQRLVLISTVDVYAQPDGVDENIPADMDNPAAYGRNRALLEQLVRGEYPNALIVRLPGLYGAGLKKNFLYDFLTLTPAMLRENKFREMAEKNALVRECYAPARNGFYALQPLEKARSDALRAWFAQNDFNALSFTDSRAAYQFYDLSCLWKDISWALAADLKLLNLAVAPVTAAELYRHLTHGGVFYNELPGVPARYDMRSKYDVLYDGADGYLYSREEMLDRVAAFVAAARREGE